MHTVFLVEDEPLIRQNIRKTIEKNAELYTCIGEAADGELALSIIRDLKPDILIERGLWIWSDPAFLLGGGLLLLWLGIYLVRQQRKDAG